MTTDVKIIRKRVENIEEIRAYLKLGVPLMQISSALGKVYGPEKVSYERDHSFRKIIDITFKICSKICCDCTMKQGNNYK